MLPLNKNRLPELFRQAQVLMQRGENRKALNALQVLVEQAPKQPEFRFHLGRLHAVMGQWENAVEHLAETTRLAPREPNVWAALADAAAGLGDDKVIRRVRGEIKKAKLDPQVRISIQARLKRDKSATKRTSGSLEVAVINQVAALLDAMAFADALKITSDLVKAHPRNPVAWTMHGVALNGENRNAEAEKALREALAIDPDYGEALGYLGEVLLQSSDRLEEAAQVLERAHQRLPRAPRILGALGRAHYEKGDIVLALEHQNSLVSQQPTIPEGRLARARTLCSLSKYAAALEDLDWLQDNGHDSLESGLQRAETLQLMGRHADAVQVLKMLEAEHGPSPRIAKTKGTILQAGGDAQAARAAFEEALDSGEESGAVYLNLARGQRFTEVTPLVERMQAAHTRGTLHGADLANLNFALAKAFEDLDRADESWTHLKQACDLMLKLTPPSPGVAEQNRKREARFYSDFDPVRIGTCGHAEDRTIFVSGMPRSGTTLVEQIISSHSTVTGCGESPTLKPLVGALMREQDPAAGRISKVSDARLAQLGRDYAAGMEALHGPAQRRTDKSLRCAADAGLIWLSLPNARLVSVKRDPRDTLFSIYKTQFTFGSHRYSYGLDLLVEEYRNHLAEVERWKAHAPERLYEISYESLVHNPEAETRKLLEFCDLEWEDACLNFHQNTRSVQTLSMYQVRQPMYRSSVAAWKKFEAHLGPLLDGLAEFVDFDD